VRDVNGALKQGSRRQWKFELQLIVERDGAVGMYQHAFVSEVEHFTRRDIRSLDEPPCSLDREAEKSPFLIHGPLFVGSVQSYRKVYARSGFPSCVSMGGKRPMVRWNVKKMRQLLAFSELRGKVLGRRRGRRGPGIIK
jgi:hypothetical protein